MSRQERHGTRSLAYSVWHRSLADELVMIDVDGLEYCWHCRDPLALVEAVCDVGQLASMPKTTTVVERLAYRADIPAVLCVYTTSPDGAQLLDAKLYSLPHRTLLAATADGMAAWLTAIRRDHRHDCRGIAA